MGAHDDEMKTDLHVSWSETCLDSLMGPDSEARRAVRAFPIQAFAWLLRSPHPAQVSAASCIVYFM